MRKRFIGTCVGASSGEAIRDMVEKATPITRATFLKSVDEEEMIDIERSLGYERRHSRVGLTMAKDWHVGYFKSFYEGRPVVYFDHSRIEHIFG